MKTNLTIWFFVGMDYWYDKACKSDYEKMIWCKIDSMFFNFFSQEGT